MLRIQIRDLGPWIRCLFAPVCEIRYPGWVKIKIRIRDENPRSYFRELGNNFLGKKYFILWCGSGSGIRNLVDFGSGIRDKHPGSAALIYNTVNGLGVAGSWEKVCGGRSAYNNRQPGLIIKLIYCKLGDLNTFFLYFLLITGIIFLKRLLGKPYRIDIPSSLDFLSCCTYTFTYVWCSVQYIH